MPKLPLPLLLYLLFLAALLGLALGSFCNAWACRLVQRESIVRGRSHCAACGHALAARDLVPLFSYLLLQGQCRYCGAPISMRYPCAEAVSALFFVSVVLCCGLTWTTLRLLLLGCLLLVLSLVDWESRELPDGLVLAAALCFVLRIPEEGWGALWDGVLGAFAVAGPLLLFVLLADKVAGRETMGGGDIKLIAALGLHFGPAGSLLLLILSSLAGILLSLPRRRHSGDKGPVVIPFGPAIASGAWLVMLSGRPLIAWYLSLF